MSDERERGEVRPADYIKRAKKADGLEFPVDVSDWRNAQVIEARWRGARHILTCNRVDPVFSTFDGRRPNYHELSDVRVIVDAEGKVVPPPITDEMVDVARESLREWVYMGGSASVTDFLWTSKGPDGETIYHPPPGSPERAAAIAAMQEADRVAEQESLDHWNPIVRAALAAALGGADHD